MKYLLMISILFFYSCESLLLGNKKLTYNNSMNFIQPMNSKEYKNEKFYILPVEKIKECRGYPQHFIYLGCQNGFSFFQFYGKVKYYDEIDFIAIHDSLCINEYPKTISDEMQIRKCAKIINNKIVIE